MSVMTRLQNSQRARILSRAAKAAITVARAPRGLCLGYCRAMSHATMDAQELLPRKSLHKSSKNKNGDFLTVKARINPIYNPARPGIHKALQNVETVEWK